MDPTVDRSRPNVPSLSLSRKDSGGAAVEFAVVALPLLLITFMVVQASLVFYARSTALAAATQGANAARAYNADLSAGTAKAYSFLNQVGGGLQNPTATTTSAGNGVRVTVTGDAISVLPWLSFEVTQSASGPIERFVP